jgi:hypothetical protein
MLKLGEGIRLSASDLVGHLNCRNLTELDLAVAKGNLAKPKVWKVPSREWLEFESGVISGLRKQTRIGVSAPMEITP